MANPAIVFTDGVNTVTLDGTDGWILDYRPATPNLRLKSDPAGVADGGEQTSAKYDNVSEQAEIHLIGGIATVRATVARLERIFHLARQYLDLPDRAPLYKFKPDSGDAYYRSPLLSGRVVWGKETLDYQYAAGEVDVTIIWTRRFYLEADSESELPLRLSGEGGSGSTGGRTLTNHDDSGHKNWADIVAGQVAGDLPAAARIEIANSTAATEAKVYVSNEIVLSGTAVTAVLEGEAGTGGATQADANSSGGNFQRLTWTGTSEADLLSWTFAAADLAAAGGRYFRALLRFANTFAYTDLWLRLKLTANGVVIWQGNKVLMAANTSLQELHNVPLPSALAGLASLNAATVVLQATRIAGGSCTLDVDYLQFLALDGWRRYTPISGGLANTDALHDDGIANAVYTKVGANKVPSYTAVGTPILLAPNDYTQRLRVLMARSDASAPIADTFTLRVYYRPRRLTI